MKKTKALWITIPFLCIIFVLALLNILDKDNPISGAENRALTQRPVIGKTGDMSYSMAYEKYFKDQFIFRDKILKLSLKGDILLGKSSLRGYCVVDNGDNSQWIVQNNRLRLSKEKAEEYANIINSYAKTLKKRGIDVYYASTPQKENILNHLMPEYSNSFILLRNKYRFESSLNRDLLKIINIRDSFTNNFSKNDLESFYFKTDNHWNSKGAYEGFKVIIDGMNQSLHLSINEDEYTTIFPKDKHIQGIYANNLYNIFPQTEPIPYVYKKDSPKRDYYLHNGKEFVKVESNKIIATGIKNSTLTYPLAYTSSSIHYKTINKNPIINKKLLIYRDSYHSAMSWLFEDIFREVEVIDPRYIDKSNTTSMNISKTTDADIVLFMFNDMGFSNMIDEM